MSVRMHISHGKTGSRRSHHRAQAPKLTKSEGTVRRRHFADPATGMYRGKQILPTGKKEAATKAVAARSATSKKKVDGAEKKTKKKSA